MEPYKMVRLSELGEEQAIESATIFADCLMEYFKSICKDRDKFIKTFTQALVREKIWTCVLKDEVVGIIAYTKKSDTEKIVDFKPLRENFGVMKGYIAYNNLVRMPSYLERDEIYLEIVLTHEKYRRRGVATTMIEYVRDKTTSQVYTLDVMEDNKGAIRLYEGLGFKVVQRKKPLFVRQEASERTLYMKYKK